MISMGLLWFVALIWVLLSGGAIGGYILCGFLVSGHENERIKTLNESARLLGEEVKKTLTMTCSECSARRHRNGAPNAEIGSMDQLDAIESRVRNEYADELEKVRTRYNDLLRLYIGPTVKPGRRKLNGIQD